MAVQQIHLRKALHRQINAFRLLQQNINVFRCIIRWSTNDSPKCSHLDFKIQSTPRMNVTWYSGVKAGRKINPESNCWYVPNVPPHPYLPFFVPPADRPPLMAVTPGVEDGRVYFICSGPIGGLFVFHQTSVGRSGTIPMFIPLSVKAAHIPWVFFSSSPSWKWCTLVLQGWNVLIQQSRWLTLNSAKEIQAI